jgi:Fe-S-cluster containining protein
MKCKKCGACCRFIALEHINPGKKHLEYYDARGWTYDPNTDIVWIPSLCPQLLPDNSCAIYKTRPEQCRLYPKRTPGLVIPPGCAFKKSD